MTGIELASCQYLSKRSELATRICQGPEGDPFPQRRSVCGGLPEISGWGVVIEYDAEQVQYVDGTFQPSDFIAGLLPVVADKPGRLTVGGTELGTDPQNGGDGALGTLSFKMREGYTDSTALIITQVVLRHAKGSIQQETRIRREGMIIRGSTAGPGDFNRDGEVDFAHFFLP